MTPAFWLCLLLVIASGLSAYIGNEWGRKLGKRKLSIFRMRPKHSSVFITVLLSMCLSLGLMGILFTALPDLQNAFFNPGNSSAEQKAFSDYESAIQEANGRLQRFAQAERSVNPAPASLAAESTLPKPLSASKKVASASASPSLSEPPTRIPQAETAQTQTAPSKRPASPPKLTVAPRLQQSLQPKTQQNRQRETESRLKIRREQRIEFTGRSEAALVKPSVPVSEPASKPISPPANPAKAVLSDTLAALPSYPTGALFELTVNGELNNEEAMQLRQGIQRLTQDYLSLLGIQEGALSFKSAQLQQEIVKLNASGQYRLQIALSPSQNTAIPVDILVSKLNRSATSPSDNETFDPQRLLEEQRLQSGSTQQSLQQDLQAVLQKHAKQQQIALNIAPKAPARARSAQLPFEILNIINQDGVIRGELFLR